MTQGGVPNPFSREGSRPEDGLGADLAGPGVPPPGPGRPAGGPVPAWQPAPAEPGRPAPPPQAYAPVPPAQYAAHPQPAQQPHGAYPYPQFGHVQPPLSWGPFRQNAPFATAALIAGITSLFVCLTGPIAIGLGIAGLRQVRAEPGVYTGEGMAVTGIVTGAFGTFILTLIALALTQN